MKESNSDNKYTKYFARKSLNGLYGHIDVGLYGHIDVEMHFVSCCTIFIRDDNQIQTPNIPNIWPEKKTSKYTSLIGFIVSYNMFYCHKSWWQGIIVTEKQ